MIRDDHVLLSRPVKLHWAGWETNTYRLQQAGWSLSAEEDIRDMRMRLALRHEGHRIYGLTAGVDFDFMGARYNAMDMVRATEAMTIPVQHMASRLTVQSYEHGGFNFRPIDATPQFLERRIQSIEDFAHFATPLARTQEIILPEESVPELLERILKLQQPARTDRLREQLRADRDGLRLDATPRQKFHAQILSIAA